MVDPKVLIGISTGEYSRRADFYDYYNLLTKPKDAMVLLCHDRSPAKARNLIIEQAFLNNCTHILFIDDDQAYKEDTLLKLLTHNKDMVSGVYYGRAYPHQPLIFDFIDDEGKAFYTYMDETKKGLQKIEAAGFGFLLVKTSIFEKLEKPYVRLGEIDPEQWCDDIGFFWRCKKAGIELYVDYDCKIGHMGTMIVWPTQAPDGSWLTTYDTNGKGALATPQIVPEHGYAFEK